MPKLKDITLEQYLNDRFGENAEGLQSQFDNCGKSHEFMAGWLTLACNQDSNKFFRLTFGKEHEPSKQQETVRRIVRQFISQLK